MDMKEFLMDMLMAVRSEMERAVDQHKRLEALLTELSLEDRLARIDN